MNPLETAPVEGTFVFTRDVNIVEIVAVLMPMLIGILVALYFHKPSDRRLLIKQTLVDQIKQIDNNLEELVDTARANKLAHTQAASISKKCTTSIEAVFTKLTEYGIDVKNSDVQTFQVGLHRLRSPLTDMPIRNNEESNRFPLIGAELSINEDGVCCYSLNRITEIDFGVANIRKDLLTLILDVHNND